MGQIQELVGRWRAAGVIDEGAAGRILEFEQARRDEGEGGPGVLEVLVYLGAAIVAAGVSVLVGSSWEDFRDWARVAVLAVPALLGIGAGQLLRGLSRPELVRGGHTIWLLATALAGAAAGVIAHNAGAGDSGVPLAFGVTAFGAGVALWLAGPSPQQVLGVAGPLLLVGGALGARGDDEVAVTGLSFIVFGLVMLALGEARLFFPRGAVRLVGTAETVIGAYVTTYEHGGFEVMALAVAAALTAVSVARGSLAMLAGGVGLFFIVTVSSIVRHVDNTNAAAAALIVVGVALVGAVLLIARSRPWKASRRPSVAA